jgi:hypothetical protein
LVALCTNVQLEVVHVAKRQAEIVIHVIDFKGFVCSDQTLEKNGKI